MPAIVNSVKTDSIADDLEIRPNDQIISIDDITPEDLLDYRYLISSEEIALHIKRSNGEEEIIDIEKDADEDLGINFESAVFDRIIPCTNKCVFCFVDQQPKGLRDSLYIKDDDYRLSYLQGTYITLSNLTVKQKKRIETLRPGPLYISVHTTNPDLRSYMLKNPGAKNIIKNLKWLDSLDIPVHVQIVLCPGINDGEELTRTLDDLSQLSNVLSIAVVPVGITKYRQDGVLCKVDAAKAAQVISQIEIFNKKAGFNLAFPSDEFFILAGCELPDSSFYRGFGQLDDGVGVSRLLLDDFDKQKSKLPKSLPNPKTMTIATGQIACYTLKPIIESLNRIGNLKVNLVPVKSNFWGDDVTVSGLITGQDILDNLIPIKPEIKSLILPSVMIRKFTDEFLDSLRLEDIQDNLGVSVQLIHDCNSTSELINMIIN